MRVFFAGVIALAFALLGASAPALADGGEVRMVSGVVTYVSATAVEVNGTRGSLTPNSSIMSDRREISLGSVRRGVSATMEIDDVGRILELQVRGVIE
jgi:hypothetical protein